MVSHFQITGHFEANAPMTPQSDLERYEVKCHAYFISVTGIPESQCYSSPLNDPK